jgi:hypothetical protein
MLWSFRLFLLLFLPFALAAADHHLFGGALAETTGALTAAAGF